MNPVFLKKIESLEVKANRQISATKHTLHPPEKEAAVSEWKMIQLKELCSKIGSGAAPRGGKEAYKGGTTTLIFSQNIYNEGFHRNGLVTINDQQAKELDNVGLRPCDVFSNITGNFVARCYQVAEDVLLARVNQQVAIIRPHHNELDARFLRYVLVSPSDQTHMLSLASAGAIRNVITKAMIENMEVTLPPLPEQKRIAHILGTLDDKIELNRRINATLEAIARALFKSWFIDFDPVHSNAHRLEKKRQGRNQPSPPAPLPEGEGSAFGMDAETVALFPFEFQESPLGKIPKGWETDCVGEVITCVGGATPSTAEPKFWEEGTHHWTTPKDFSSLQTPFLINTERKITDAGVAAISSGILPAGTLLLSSRAPVGYLAIATVDISINQGFIAMKCNERASNFFMLNWCQTNMAEIESRATGTTFAEISKKNFRPIRVVLPTKELMFAFTQMVKPLYEKIIENLIQSHTLANQRDTLLPKLLRGEITTTLTS